MAHPDKLDSGSTLSAAWDDSSDPEGTRTLSSAQDAPDVAIVAPHASLSTDESGFDPGLARLLEEVTRRIEAGEHVDADELAAQHPTWSGPIRRLLPAVADLQSRNGINPTNE